MSESTLSAVIGGVFVAIGEIVGGLVSSVIIRIMDAGHQPAESQDAGPGSRGIPRLLVMIIGIILGGLVCGAWGLAAPYLANVMRPKPFIPLEEACHYDFERTKGVTDTGTWTWLPDDREYDLSISNDRSHSGTSSLRLRFNMKRWSMTDQTEYAGVGLTEGLELPVVACEAWVLIDIPRLPSGYDPTAVIHGYAFAKNGTYGVFSGEDKNLRANEWTPVFWSGSYTFKGSYPVEGSVRPEESKTPEPEPTEYSFDSANRMMSQWWLTVRIVRSKATVSSEATGTSYQGDLYIDDISCYSFEK